MSLLTTSSFSRRFVNWKSGRGVVSVRGLEGLNGARADLGTLTKQLPGFEIVEAGIVQPLRGFSDSLVDRFDAEIQGATGSVWGIPNPCSGIRQKARGHGFEYEPRGTQAGPPAEPPSLHCRQRGGPRRRLQRSGDHAPGLRPVPDRGDGGQHPGRGDLRQFEVFSRCPRAWKVNVESW